MVWVTPKTFTANATLTAAELNTYLRDNLMATAPPLCTKDGMYFVGAGLNTIASRELVTARVKENQSTTSTSYTDLATVGPSVTTPTSSYAFVVHGGWMRNSTADISGQAMMSWAISGAHTRAAADSTACEVGGASANKAWRIYGMDLLSDITPGVNTFTCKYKVAAGTGSFSDRFIGVMPL